jgi:WD40 repeat protein
MRLAFHPSEALLAASTVSGEVGIFEYGLEGNTQRALLQHHELSTRALQYSHDGSTLFMGSKDCTISAYDLARACVSGTMSNAHDTAISCLRVIDENILVSGDDDGLIKVWDLRQARCVHELNEHSDFISDIQLGKDEKTLVCSGGDGYLRCTITRSGARGSRAATWVCEMVPQSMRASLSSLHG